MSSSENFRNVILRRICFAVAQVIYHLVTLYDKARTLYTIFRSDSNDNFEARHLFAYPPIRLNRYWHTTRVLQLAPGAGVEPLEGVLMTNVTIKIFSWAWTFGERHYDAISYCWGQSTATKMVYLHGKLLQVTETLHTALQSLRRKDSPVLLWVDQICIDQSQAAVVERNRQVQRMGEIYANADSVIIWLGKPTRTSDEIFDCLNTLNELDLPDQPSGIDGQAAATYPEDRINAMISSLQGRHGASGLRKEGQVKEQLVMGLRDLVNNAWFSRIWVVQEAALAKNLFVQAGSRRVLWTRFVACIRSVKEMVGIPLAEMRLVYDIETLRQQKLSEDLDYDDLLTIIETFRGRQATDLRDKIYGLFGLVKPGIQGRAFQADYLRSPQQVFADFTVWHIQVYGNVRALAKCCSEEINESSKIGSHEPRLPSWATDWSVDSAGDCGNLVDDSFANKTGPHLYNASRGLRAGARVVSEHVRASLPPVGTAVLVLSGIVLDTVGQVVDRMSTWEDVGDPRNAAWMEWRRVALQQRMPDPYGTRSARIDAFWRTLIIDRMSTSERATSSIGTDFETLLQFDGSDVGPDDSLPGSGNGNSMSSVYCNDSEVVRIKFAEWLRKWNSFRIGKKLFRTERGYLGISCEHVRRGDRLAILWGGRLPYILRQHGDTLLPGVRGRPSLTDDTVVPTYKLIGGECYVHGLADGEGLDIAERHGIRPTKICLV
jgi:hypothetical protein